MCGRCEAAMSRWVCNLNAITAKANVPDYTQELRKSTRTTTCQPQPALQPAKVAYFAGCMGHLTPAVIQAMQQIFRESRGRTTPLSINEAGSLLRPAYDARSGNRKAATSESWKKPASPDRAPHGPALLVTSCPICYKTFREEYLIEPKGHAPHRIH